MFLPNKNTRHGTGTPASWACSVLASLITLLLTLIPCTTLGAEDYNNRVVLTDQRGAYPLGLQLAILEDPTKSLGIEDVTSPAYADKFLPSTKSVPGFGFSSSAYWVRVALERQTTREAIWLLEFSYAPMQWIDVYTRSEGGQFQHQRGGLGVPYAERPSPHPEHVFELNLPPDQTTELWLRVDGESSKNLPLTLWRADAFAQETSLEFYALGMYFGVILALILYNLFIYHIVREPAYAYYVLFLCAFAAMTLSLNGLAQQFLWPNQPEWAMRAIPFFIGLVGLFGGLFVMSFIQTRALARWLHRLMWVGIVWSIATILLSLLSTYYASIISATTLVVAFSILALVVGLYAAVNGNKPARYYLFAWVLLLFGLIAIALRNFGVLPTNLITEYGMLWGSASEAILLSVALAARMRVMKEEKEAAQQQALENQQKAHAELKAMSQELEAANLNLEHRVHERTAALEASNRQLADAKAATSSFLANMSHELRTPMNAVIGYSEMLHEELEEENQDKYLPDLAKIRAAGKHLLGMINEVLDLSKIEAGKMELFLEPVEVSTLITDVESTVAPLMEKRGNRLEVTYAKELGVIETDTTKLRQILLNLLSNAAKFTEAGLIDLNVWREADADGDWLNFAVRDSGIGMTQDQLAKVFEAFSQAETSTTRNFGGTGLGLTISKHFCEMLGGTLSVTSREGVGSTFTITLPLRTQESNKAG